MMAVKACPRCGGEVTTSSYEPSCLMCGWADYSAPAGRLRRQIGDVLPKVARYAGPVEGLKDVTCELWGGVPDCPYCGQPTRLHHGYYACPAQHNIRLSATPDGFTWR